MAQSDPIGKNLWKIISETDDSKLATALASLADRWECPFCGSDRMTFFPSPNGITRTPLIGKELMGHNVTIPTLLLSCGNCGYMAEFWPRPIIEELVRLFGRDGDGGGPHNE